MFALTGPVDGKDGRGQRPGSEDERRGPGSCLRCRTSGQQVSLSLHSFLLVYLLVFLLNVMLWFIFGGQISLSVCVRFLESQLRGQHSQREEELEALRLQLSQAISGSSSAAQQQVSTYWCSYLWYMKDTVEKLCIRWKEREAEYYNIMTCFDVAPFLFMLPSLQKISIFLPFLL